MRGMGQRLRRDDDCERLVQMAFAALLARGGGWADSALHCLMQEVVAGRTQREEGFPCPHLARARARARACVCVCV